MARLSILTALLVLAFGAGCASLEGTIDKSRTTKRAIDGPIESVAVLPVPESAAAPGLSDRLAAAMAGSLAARLPGAKVVDADGVGSELARRRWIASYGNWRSGYDQTGIVDPGPARALGQALEARYLLLVRDVDVSREKIRAVDVGRNGMISDANKVWRSKLRVSAVLVDTEQGTIAWRGMAEAENIWSPNDKDFGVVIIHERLQGVEVVLPEMVQVAADGMADQVMGAPPAKQR